MNKITIISLVSTGFLVTMPFEANALNSQLVSQNLLEKTNLRVAQGRPTYQRGYTVHYRSSRAGMASLLENRKWTLEGFHAERSDAERAASRLQQRVLEPKLDRVQQPNVAGLETANHKVQKIIRFERTLHQPQRMDLKLDGQTISDINWISTMNIEHKNAVGTFPNFQQIESALRQLKATGFHMNNV